MTSAKIEKRMRLATAKKQFFPNPLCRLFGRETVVGADWSVSEKLFLRFGAFSVRRTDEMDESAVWRTQNEMKITIASECRAKREGVWGMCPRIRSRRLRRLLVQNKLGFKPSLFCTHGCSFFEPDAGRPGQDMGVTRHYPRPQQDRIIDELSTSLKDHGE